MDSKNLLVVDDDELFCQYVSLLLTEKGYSVSAETDPRRVLSLLHTRFFDVVLVDLMMPDMDGLELLDRIRSHFSALPVLVVTAHGSAEVTLEAMRRGATDFVTKPVDAPHLDLRIRAACNLEHARRRANTDGLTGLYNHRYLQERLQQEIDRVGRYGRQLSLVMADLDHFKIYNDTYGHPSGDEILIAVARTLRQVSRASDVVARYGGDEMTMVLPETPAGEARVVAERARRWVSDLRFKAGPGPDPPRISLSLGVAALAFGCRQKQRLIEAADQALYQAKHLGGNHVCVAGEDPAEVAIGDVEAVSLHAS